MSKKLLKCMEIFKEFPGCYRKVSWGPQGDFKGVSSDSSLFKGSFKGSFKSVSKMFHQICKEPFIEVYKDLSKKFQGSFIEVSKIFHGSFQG